MVTTVIAAVINIIVNWVFISIVGIWGAVIGTVIAYIVIADARMYDVGKYIKIRIDYKKYIMNSSLIIIHAVLVSIDWHIYLVSAIAIVSFVVINLTDIINLFRIEGL